MRLGREVVDGPGREAPAYPEPRRLLSQRRGPTPHSPNMGDASAQEELFGTRPDPAAWPPGLRYAEDFLTPQEEGALAERIAALPLANMRYLQYTARRRVVSYGGQYDFSAQRLNTADPLPDWLQPLMVRAAEWAGLLPSAFTQALVAEYQPGTPLGWHRDVPDFEDIVGISLHGSAVMRFRPYPPDSPKKADIVRVTLAPRSIYLLHGASRWDWQHSVAATEGLRYSVTLRTPSRRRRGR